MRLSVLLAALWWQVNAAAFVELSHRKSAARAQSRRTAGATTAMIDIGVLGTMIDPLASYRAALESYPLPTKALTNAALFGVSDVIAQTRGGGEATTPERQGARFNAPATIDLARVGELMLTGMSHCDGYTTCSRGSLVLLTRYVSSPGKFMLTGVGSGVLWASWYDTADALVARWAPGAPAAADGATAAAGAEALAATAMGTALSIGLETLVWCPLV